MLGRSDTGENVLRLLQITQIYIQLISSQKVEKESFSVRLFKMFSFLISNIFFWHFPTCFQGVLLCFCLVYFLFLLFSWPLCKIGLIMYSLHVLIILC
jgi:hypothetical protein